MADCSIPHILATSPGRIFLTVSAAAAALGAARGAAATESPLVCNLKALDSAQRSQLAALSRKLFAAVGEKKELRDGFAFRIDLAAISLVELAQWVDFERRCCPFLDFRISLEREGGALQMALTGRAGVKTFLESELAAK